MNFADVIESLPDDVPRKHHGRNPEEGFDCVGFPIWVYRQVGIELMDMPYARLSAERLNRSGAIEKRLSPCLRDVTDQVASGLDKDGDIWLFGVQGGLRHAGIQVNGFVYHMMDRMKKQTVHRVRALLVRAFRL